MRSRIQPGHVLGLLTALSVLLPLSAQAQLIGPYPNASTPYLSFNDSPFKNISFGYFYLETFEDHLLNTPGVTAPNGILASTAGPANHDSVDADDGVIDGSGLAGDNFFNLNGSQGVTFNFSAAALGSLPTHAGMVWTDGFGTITFEAFDQNGASLGTLTGNHADGSFGGGTGEDRFYGAINAGGISAIKLSNTNGGIEVDHLQYGSTSAAANTPEPGIFATLLSLGFLGTCRLARRRK